MKFIITKEVEADSIKEAFDKEGSAKIISVIEQPEGKQPVGFKY